jgi:hypothetical protein
MLSTEVGEDGSLTWKTEFGATSSGESQSVGYRYVPKDMNSFLKAIKDYGSSIIGSENIQKKGD